jgi:hypothetical protein
MVDGTEDLTDSAGGGSSLSLEPALKRDVVDLRERAGEVAAHTELLFAESFVWLARDGNQGISWWSVPYSERRTRGDDRSRIGQLPTKVEGDCWPRENRVYWTYWKIGDVLGEPADVCHQLFQRANRVLENSSSDALRKMLNRGRCGPSTSDIARLKPHCVQDESLEQVWKDLEKVDYWQDFGLSTVYLPEDCVCLGEYRTVLTRCIVSEFNSLLQHLNQNGEQMTAYDQRYHERVKISFTGNSTYRLSYPDEQYAPSIVPPPEMASLLTSERITNWMGLRSSVDPVTRR